MSASENSFYGTLEKQGPLPIDSFLVLNVLYSKDPSPEKVNVGIGSYKDDSGKYMLMKSVKQAYKDISSDPNLEFDYNYQVGYAPFVKEITIIVLGDFYDKLSSRTIAIQTLGGTGAISLAFELVKRVDNCRKPVLIPEQTWVNHINIAQCLGFNCQKYPYWDHKKKWIDEEGMLSAINNAPDESFLVLHTCNHNPTGVDLSHEQWIKLGDVVKRKRHIVLLDTAYQGFGDGFKEDRFAIDHFLSIGLPLFISYSLSKIMGLYSERLGALVHVAQNENLANIVETRLFSITRTNYSTPPKMAAKVAARVLTDPKLKKEWLEDLDKVRSRIMDVREQVSSLLAELKTPGDWSHIKKQKGMFAYLGITEKQVKRLVEEMSIYMTSDGRISVSGLNSSNIKIFCSKLHKVVCETTE